MQRKRIILIKGLGELDKLDSTGSTQTFKYVVDNCKIDLRPRKPMVMQVRDIVRSTVIVKGTTQYVALCQLLEGERAPEFLPRVCWAYI